MYGAILGDIIGSPFEFDRGNKTKNLKEECRNRVPEDMLEIIDRFDKGLGR